LKGLLQELIGLGLPRAEPSPGRSQIVISPNDLVGGSVLKNDFASRIDYENAGA
jgi:hypothetical protein